MALVAKNQIGKRILVDVQRNHRIGFGVGQLKGGGGKIALAIVEVEFVNVGLPQGDVILAAKDQVDVAIPIEVRRGDVLTVLTELWNAKTTTNSSPP